MNSLLVAIGPLALFILGIVFVVIGINGPPIQAIHPSQAVHYGITLLGIGVLFAILAKLIGKLGNK